MIHMIRLYALQSAKKNTAIQKKIFKKPTMIETEQSV